MIDLASSEYYRVVNELLREAKPMQAYFLGILSATLMLSPLELSPDRSLFEDALQCRTPAEANWLAETWIKNQTAESA